MKAWIEAVLIGAMLSLWLHGAALAHEATRVAPLAPAASASASREGRSQPPSRPGRAASQPATSDESQLCVCVSPSLSDKAVLPRRARA
jgi:hypothetical protein